MWTMIIADDEPLITRGIQKMIDWKQMGIEIVGCCKGREQRSGGDCQKTAGYSDFGYFYARENGIGHTEGIKLYGNCHQGDLYQRLPAV